MQSATEPSVPESGRSAERGRVFWLALGSLVVVQLVAMWLLCSHQVRVAEARRAETQVQAMALSDCLEYIPGSTIASCTGHMAAAARASDGAGDATGVPAPAATAPVARVALPVNFSYR
jgi:hypothetical protein